MKLTTLCYMEKDGQYLMLYRNKKNNDPNAGKWIGVGGHFLDGESPEECLYREVKEETGCLLKKYAFRGIVTFSSDVFETEYMCLYTATEWEGEPKVKSDAADGLADCDEGDLYWIPKEKVAELNLWEGDKVFLKLLNETDEFFSLKLIYEGDELVSDAVCFAH